MNRAFLVLGLGAALCLALAAPAAAVLLTLDQVPAATLLLPYFEVDLDDPEWSYLADECEWVKD